MKLNKKVRNVRTSDNLSEEKFSIAASAHAFEILSSRLYTDTILAIIRELSTNAADSHVAAGHPNLPFGVHLPNNQEPFFEVRDFGTGLSHDDVMHVYTTYFDSTRNNSNDFTGALGLGSKSPFAYTDTFLVTSYYDGTKRSYCAYKNEAGEPAISLMGESNTDEPNGLQVRIEVAPEDFDEFYERAQDVYEYFNVRPNVVGRTLFFNDEVPTIQGSDWQIFYTGFSSNGIKVVMGNVCYRVDHDKFQHSLSHYATLIVKVPIGTCSVAANREELHYDDMTRKNLQTILDSVFVEAYNIVTEETDQATCLWDKIVTSKKFQEVIKLSCPNYLELIDEGYDVVRYFLNSDRIYKGRETTVYPSNNRQLLIVENDLDELTQSRRNAMRVWIENKGGRDAYLANIHDDVAFAEVFGKPTIKLSDIPDPPRKQSVSKGGKRYSIKTLKRYPRRKSEAWENADPNNIDIEKGIAVQRKGYKVIFNGREITTHEAYEFAISLGYETIYGLPVMRFDKMRSDLGLDSLESEGRKKINDILQNGSDAQLACLVHPNCRYYHDISDSLLDAIAGQGGLCDTLFDFLKEEQSDTWRDLRGKLGIDVPKVESPIDTFLKKYPLLVGTTTEVSKEDIREYIQWKNLNS